MSLMVKCYYCGAGKELEAGTVVKLSCELCCTETVILDRPAHFKCVLCGRIFRLPAGKQVPGRHNVEDCLGRALILLDY